MCEQPALLHSPVMDHRKIGSYVKMWVEDLCKNHRAWNLYTVILVNSSFIRCTTKEFVICCLLNYANIKLYHYSKITINCTMVACWRTRWHQGIIKKATAKTCHQRQTKPYPCGPICHNYVTFCGYLITKTGILAKWPSLVNCTFFNYVQEETEIFVSLLVMCCLHLYSNAFSCKKLKMYRWIWLIKLHVAIVSLLWICLATTIIWKVKIWYCGRPDINNFVCNIPTLSLWDTLESIVQRKNPAFMFNVSTSVVLSCTSQW